MDELDLYINKIRNVVSIKGNKNNFFAPSEKYARSRKRSIYISKNIKRGEKFTKKNIKIIRPGKGLHSKYFEGVLGKIAKKNLVQGTPLKKSHLKS